MCPCNLWQSFTSHRMNFFFLAVSGISMLQLVCMASCLFTVCLHEEFGSNGSIHPSTKELKIALNLTLASLLKTRQTQFSLSISVGLMPVHPCLSCIGETKTAHNAPHVVSQGMNRENNHLL